MEGENESPGWERNSEQEFSRHLPVLLDEVLGLFDGSSGLQRGLRILDCTLGGGGHSAAFLERWSNSTVTAIDRDQSAINRAGERIAAAGSASRLQTVHGSFADLDLLLPPGAVYDCVLADLGFSSDQLDDPQRGFSLKSAGPLDMRLDRSQQLSAEQVINCYDFRSLSSVFRRGGCAASSARLAQSVLDNRPIKDTLQLAAVCRETMVKFDRKRKRKSAKDGAGKRGADPATVPFQAVRIEVNDELRSIERFLDQLPQRIAAGGTCAVITFHSLEDQLVTSRMRAWSQAISHGRGGPVEREALGELLTPKAVVPSEKEISANPRAHSARLRAFRRNDSSDLN